MTNIAKNTIGIWYEREAEAAARFYASVFPDSEVLGVYRSPMDNPGNKAGDEALRAFEAMVTMRKSDVEAIDAARRSAILLGGQMCPSEV